MHYASHQNGSLATEYAPLWADVERSLPWADASLGGLPAATNFWMGEDAARTTVRADLRDEVACLDCRMTLTGDAALRCTPMSSSFVDN